MSGTKAGAAKRKRCPRCGAFHTRGDCPRTGAKKQDPWALIEAGRVIEPSGCHSYHGKTWGRQPVIGWKGPLISRLLLGIVDQPGLVARHTCDNNWCINLEHLLPGTQADNLRDMRERNRQGPNRWELRQRDERGRFAKKQEQT